MNLILFLLLNLSLAQTAPDTSAAKNLAAQKEIEARQAIAKFKADVNTIVTMVDACQPLPTLGADACTACRPAIERLETLDFSKLTAIDACISTAGITEKSCAASTYAPWVSLVISQFNSSAGGNYDRCKKAATLQTGMGAISGALAGTCYFTKRKCESACTIVSNEFTTAFSQLQTSLNKVAACDPAKIQGKLADIQNKISLAESRTQACAAQELNIASALLSVQQLVQGIAQSNACQKELEPDECTTREAANNPACTAAYCANPANRSSPQCVAVFGECYSADAAANPRCACLQNPMQAGCINLPPINTNTGTGSFANRDPSEGYDFDVEDDGFDVDPSIAFGDATSKAPGIVGNNQGGGGGGPGNGNALGGGPGGGGSSAPKGVYNTDVMGGVSSGSGMVGGSAGGGGGYGAGTNMGGLDTRGIAGSGLGKGSLDLKKYLPGGQFAKQREANDPASMGITPANGLSNFQKVNRALNNNRSKLVNP